MKNYKSLITGCCLTALFLTVSTEASPTCDDQTAGQGCIDLGNGESGIFDFHASFDVQTYTYSGSLHYMDTSTGLIVTSDQLLDYSDPDTNMRGFIFASNNPDYSEIRVIVWDYGTSGDFFEIQLHNGSIVYQVNGFLTETCGGGITIVSDCSNNPPGGGAGENPPPPTNPGTGTPGYWMNHPEAWPIDAITIGGVTYSQAEAIALMKRATRKDVTYSMFQAIVATTLNVLIGNDSSCITGILDDGEAWLEANPLGSGVSGKSSPWQNGGEAIKNALDEYNNGLLCAPSRG